MRVSESELVLTQHKQAPAEITDISAVEEECTESREIPINKHINMQ